MAALTDHHILSTILHHLSDMKYKDRRQYGPDQPVEFLEFRPTLVPSILVNKMWADEGTSILCTETLDYLKDLNWPNLKSLELEVDLQTYGSPFVGMLHDGLEHVELSGNQSGGSRYFADTILSTLFNPCKNLKSIRIGSDTIMDDDPVHASALYEHLDATPSIKTVEVKSANLMDKDALFVRLSQRSGLEGLEIDLDPGIALLPLLSGPHALATPFAFLRRASLMCYPEVALALLIHLRVIEELQLDVARIASLPSQPSDISIFEDILAEASHCSQLRLLKIGVGLLAVDFPSSTSLPRLSGSALIGLAKTCQKLEDINLLATEPSAIDGSLISREDFDIFCQFLPNLRSLKLKFHPTTMLALQTSALQSLGRHCPMLDVLRLKVALQLPSLPVPDRVPQILISGGSTPEPPCLEEKRATANEEDIADSEVDHASIKGTDFTATLSSQDVSPFFPKLTHLALSRPESALAAIPDSFTSSSSSYSNSAIVDPNVEEDLVRSWAHPLLTHFPRLEILEAWGDWTGQDNESLNYFLPTQETLASTWEFLSGIEQDLWEDDDEPFEEDSWNSLEDWERASLINEFIVEEQDVYPDIGKLSVQDEEPEGMITPGRTLEHDEYFGVFNDTHTGNRT
ncbi:hypothetical protein N0V90_003311 [Kalmusia sp. IMI 367209]|nr:hypothetical protein N0V90_003311 [Kalmusia sp. IMI 367209]